MNVFALVTIMWILLRLDAPGWLYVFWAFGLLCFIFARDRKE